MTGRTAWKAMKKLWFRLWIILWPITIVLFLYPINNRPLRIGLILSIACLWAGCLFLGWRRRYSNVAEEIRIDH